jgi:hydroxymethylpyrimidine pyrophosphatase-like HAD family hydrolase
LYRLVALDIDGTLIDKSRAVTARTRRAIARVQEAGIALTLITGRAFTETAFLAGRLGVKGPIACNNGAHIVEMATGQELFYRPLPRDAAAALLGALDREGVFYWANRRGEIVLRRQHLQRYLWRPVTLRRRNFWQWAVSYVRWAHEKLVHQQIRAEERIDPTDIGSICAYGDVAPLASAAAGLEGVAVTRAGAYLDATPAGINKAVALESIARWYGVPRAATVAVGDGENDVEMIAWAGLGVAMANADPVVIAAARQVTASHEEDGVAQVLEEILTQQGGRP